MTGSLFVVFRIGFIFYGTSGPHPSSSSSERFGVVPVVVFSVVVVTDMAAELPFTILDGAVDAVVSPWFAEREVVVVPILCPGRVEVLRISTLLLDELPGVFAVLFTVAVVLRSVPVCSAILPSVSPVGSVTSPKEDEGILSDAPVLDVPDEVVVVVLSDGSLGWQAVTAARQITASSNTAHRAKNALHVITNTPLLRIGIVATISKSKEGIPSLLL